jgi:hypothetical protein
VLKVRTRPYINCAAAADELKFFPELEYWDKQSAYGFAGVGLAGTD